jgi:D-alanyl-D-alanine carboxypeptidase
LPKRRYSYTPRRNGKTTPRRRSSSAPASDGHNLPLVPIAIILGSFGLAVWLIAFRGGPSEAGTGDQAAVLDSGSAPEQLATPVPSATPVVHGPAAPADAAPAPTPFVPGNAPAPAISGGTAAVFEEPCGKMLWGLNESTQLPPASLTKIATALVVADKKPLTDTAEVLVDGGALSINTGATVMGLRPGQKLTVYDLVSGLMIRSGNDAALTLAQATAGNEAEFVKLMNEKVTSLGLKNTHFVNSHGLDATAHFSSAYDMGVLGSQLLKNKDLAAIVASQSYTPSWDGGQLTNINLLLSNYPGAIGIKTGYTDLAGMTIVAAADRNGRRLIVSVMQSSDVYVDAMSLLDWAYANTAPACDSPPAQAAAINP